MVKTLFIMLLVFLTNLFFSEQKLPKKQILISEVDRLIVSLKNSKSINESIQKENEIYNLAKYINYKKGLITARFTLLTRVFNQHKYDLFLKLIDKSIDESNKIDSSNYLPNLLIMKASCYSALGLHEESRVILNQAKDLAMKLPNNDAHHYALSSIFRQIGTNLIQYNNSSDSALFYYRRSYNQLKKTKSDSNYYKLMRMDILTRIGHIYSSKKQYDSARKYLSNTYQINEKEKQKDIMLTLQNYINISELHFIDKEYYKAINCYKGILSIADSLNLSYYKQNAYYKLSEIYGKLNDKKRENAYLKEFTKITDSLHSSEKTIIRAPLEKIITEKKGSTAKDKIFYILIPIMVICIVSFYLRFNKARKRDSFDNKNRFQTTVQPKIESYENAKGSKTYENLDRIIELAKQNDPTLYAQFKAFDPAFTKKMLLIAPDLLASELEICIYFRLNFETKEIVNYTNFSLRAVQGKKHRIRRKLKISSQENLNTWLNNI